MTTKKISMNTMSDLDIIYSAEYHRYGLYKYDFVVELSYSCDLIRSFLLGR